MSSLDRIELRKLRADCIVGVYPSERSHPQPLLVDLSLGFDARRAGRGGGLAASIDYAKLAGEVRFLLTACRFHLLEAAAEALARYLLAPATADAPKAAVQEVLVRLSKPRALAGSAKASLSIRRGASEMSYEVEEKPFGALDRIFEDPGCGIHRLRIAPGEEVGSHLRPARDEWEMALGPGLLLEGRKVLQGTVFHWPKDLPRRWENPTATEQTILCVDGQASEGEVDAPVPEGIPFYPKEATEGA